MKTEAQKTIAQAKRSLMTSGGGQEEVAVSQVNLRIQEIIGEVALTGVHSDTRLDSDTAPASSVSEARDTDTDPLPLPDSSSHQ